ncbi:MAG: nucleotidyltransferase domain-containing protein [Patescibacteria group bacterium]
MRIEHYPVQKLKKEIAEIIGQYLDLCEYKIFFFGSRVSDGGNQYSDIDIGIEGPLEIPYEIMAKIKEGVENLPILYKIEIVDFKKVSPDFRKVSSANQEYL